MIDKKKVKESTVEQQSQKPTPAFLRADYKYKANGDIITDLNSLNEREVYEIKCKKCEMSLRSQGQNVRSIYEKLKSVGCIGCGNKEIVIKKLDMSAI